MVNSTRDERLNKLTRLVPRGAGIDGEEAERIAQSPFLYARIRARIKAEADLRATPRSDWLPTLFIATRATAVLLIVTIAAALAFWLSRTNAVDPRKASVDNIDRIVAGGTCAISTTDECAISNEEVLATLFADEGRRER